ncbi:MAG: response regulator [Deltaproteobacteria bacterium]|nr:response regulator [Deltaproteobacteria bacterium]
MSEKDYTLLEGKRILAVDDEPDVLDSLEELLPMCRVDKAGSYEEAEGLLKTRPYDLAILDIMGVKGYELLEICRIRGVIAVMLTAHALSPEDIVASYRRGAANYLPKERMEGIRDDLEEILEAHRKGEPFWSRWLERWDAFYGRKFGPDWKDRDRDFWESFPHVGPF